MLLFSNDKKRLLDHFLKDPVLFSYHIGDLDDFYFPNCQWMVDYAERARIEECILVYSGLDVPSVLAFKISDRFDNLLKEALDLFPKRFFCHFHKELRPIFQTLYNETELGTHMKMKLSTLIPKSDSDLSKKIVRLDQSNKNDLYKLYERAYPGNYFNDRMLESGKYFGFYENDHLLAVAGVHADSMEYKIAVLGNITTDPEHTGKGLATLLTSHLVEELVSENKMVCLNVKVDNEAAIRVYEKLGFKKMLEYEESIFELK